MSEELNNTAEPVASVSPWLITKWVCCGVVVVSVIASIALAAVRSNGLSEVTVTALDAAAEPRDHDIPFMKKKEALPDYEIVIVCSTGSKINLGAKPNTSAIDGLTWKVSEPVSTTEVSSIRLQDQDKVVSDVITEVQVTGASTVTPNYRFDFKTERSFWIGLQSFFFTPIGFAIMAGFCLGIALIFASSIYLT